MIVATVIAITTAVWTDAANAAGRRVALVIGNAAYQRTPTLDNPRNDATDMAAALKKRGFQVIEGFDLDKAAFDRKVRDFATALQGAETGVFFYAGHGIQVSGQNYLVPVDAELESAAALDFEMVRLDLVHRTMEREAKTNVVFLDACRNNPLSRNLARAMGTRSTQIGQGLAAVESGVGTLISFSTQPGNVALDGTGRNSPYAGALVRQIASSSDDLSSLLIAVRNDVMGATQGRQVPWEHSALTGRFYFASAPQAAIPGPSTAPPPARLSDAAEAWAATKDATNIAVLEAFIARYKDTFYAQLARARIEELKKQAGPATNLYSGRALQARVGNAELSLPSPIGYCELDASISSDARMIKAVEGMLPKTNRLLAGSADCGQLIEWRAGKRQLLDDFAQYQTLVTFENQDLPVSGEAAIKETCAAMRSQGEKMTTDMMPEVKTRAEQVMKDVKVNEMRFLGVISEDKLVCYAVILQKFKAETGTDKTQITVFATTILKGKIVYSYLFAPFAGGETVTQLLAKQKAVVAMLQAANAN